jgi:membrane fusion protein, multidrug efflux system
MKKRIAIALIALVLLIAVLASLKYFQIGAMISQGEKFSPPPETVTSAQVRPDSWETSLTAVGSLSAVQGVTVAAEMAGKVIKIAFEPGASVKKGELLAVQDTATEEAQLPGATAQEKLTGSDLERASKMLSEKIISQAEYDAALAKHDQARSQVNAIQAAIEKKKIRAPFSGRLGIRQINLGQMLHEADPVVTLQSLNPIFVNFSLPQQQLLRLSVSLPVSITCDTVPGTKITGRVTAINPLIDSDTRNIQVQATIENKSEKLRPGMFVNVGVELPVREKVLAVPSTSVLYAPYGDSVFVIEDKKGKNGAKVLRQQFVRLGRKLGDFVAVTGGLKEGDFVVSTGVFKLRNGQPVIINNVLAPKFRQSPTPENN